MNYVSRLKRRPLSPSQPATSAPNRTASPINPTKSGEICTPRTTPESLILRPIQSAPANWLPAGYTPPVVQKKLITKNDVYVYDALKTPQFWLIWWVLCLNVTAGIGVLAYAVNGFAPQIGADWLRHLTPFHYYIAGEPLKNGLPLADTGVLAAATAVLLSAGARRFSHRDLGR